MKFTALLQVFDEQNFTWTIDKIVLLKLPLREAANVGLLILAMMFLALCKCGVGLVANLLL